MRRAAAPFVVQTVQAAEHQGFDVVIVDCTDDPGVVMARAAVSIPVIGPGVAMATAVADARPPIRHFSGDELRSIDTDVSITRSLGARTVTLGGTGFSHVADLLRERTSGRGRTRPVGCRPRRVPRRNHATASPRAAVAQSSASSASSTKDVKSSMRSSSMANGSAH